MHFQTYVVKLINKFEKERPLPLFLLTFRKKVGKEEFVIVGVMSTSNYARWRCEPRFKRKRRTDIMGSKRPKL